MAIPVTLVSQLLAQFGLVSNQVNKQELSVILGALQTTIERQIDGAVVEFGCYRGTTTLFLRRMLNALGSDKELHAYDSFEGLPAKNAQDNSVAGDQFIAGELTVSKKDLLLEFRKASLAPPIVHKGWFNELGSSDLPNTIAFAYLDGDFYASIIDSLRLVWPRLQPGGVVCIDDYGREALPGVERAVHDYFGAIPDRVALQHSIATIVK